MSNCKTCGGHGLYYLQAPHKPQGVSMAGPLPCEPCIVQLHADNVARAARVEVLEAAARDLAPWPDDCWCPATRGKEHFPPWEHFSSCARMRALLASPETAAPVRMIFDGLAGEACDRGWRMGYNQGRVDEGADAPTRASVSDTDPDALAKMIDEALVALAETPVDRTTLREFTRSVVEACARAASGPVNIDSPEIDGLAGGRTGWNSAAGRRVRALAIDDVLVALVEELSRV